MTAPTKKVDECDHEKLGPDIDWGEVGLILNTCLECYTTISKPHPTEQMPEWLQRLC